jgi:hypothetical protein
MATRWSRSTARDYSLKTAPSDIVELLERLEFGVDDGRRVLFMVVSTGALDALNALPDHSLSVEIAGEPFILDTMRVVFREDRERLEMVWGPAGS